MFVIYNIACIWAAVLVTLVYDFNVDCSVFYQHTSLEIDKIGVSATLK